MPRDRYEPLFEVAAASAANTENKGYLGDAHIVESLLRVAVSDVADAAESGDSARREQTLVTTCRNVAGILLGLDDDYVPVRKWNTPGRIDDFVAKWVGSAETDPLERMEHAVLKMFLELFDLSAQMATPGILPEDWQFQANGILQKYTGLFLGMDLPTQALG